MKKENKQLKKYKDFLDNLIDLKNQSETMFSECVSMSLSNAWNLGVREIVILMELNEDKTTKIKKRS